MKQISFWQTFIMIALLISMTSTVKAQESELTLDDLFASPKMTGTSPSRPSWAPESRNFAFAPGATHGWSRKRNYDRYLFGKLIEYFDRYLAVP